MEDHEKLGSEETAMKRFIERDVKKTDHARCVDGRPDETVPAEKGAQMPGGTLHPIVLSVIQENSAYNGSVVAEKTRALKDAGFGVGVHGDNHSECGCGLNMKLREIIKTAKDEKDEIISRMLKILGEGDILENVKGAFDVLDRFEENNIQEVGVPIAEGAKTGGAVEEIVKDDHKESVAFVNLKPGKTFDTNRSNEEGWQAFNMDLWAAEEQAQALGVEPRFAQGASLILYMATEMVLVEQKGQTALPVVVHA